MKQVDEVGIAAQCAHDGADQLMNRLIRFHAHQHGNFHGADFANTP